MYRILIFFTRLWFCTICLLGLEQAYAQRQEEAKDSTDLLVVSDTLNVREFTLSDWMYDRSGQYVLNSIDGTHLYEPYLGFSPVRNDVGNIGSADHIMLFDQSRVPGFHFRSSRKLYWRSVSQRRLLLSDQMYSKVRYTNGANRENHLIADFTRGFGTAVDMGFRFTRINSLGFYDRQRSTITDLSVFGTFRTKDDRYRLLLIFDYRNLKIEENGGIKNDSVFENNLTRGRNFIPINLPQASNHWKGFDIGLEQRFFLSRTDTVSLDGRLRPVISHSFALDRSSMVYRDIPDTLFYNDIFNDSLKTYDSTSVLSILNTVRFELVRTKDDQARILELLSVGVQHGFHRLSYDSVWSDNVHNLSVLAQMNGSFSPSSKWRANVQFFPYGYNQWDLSVSGSFNQVVQRSSFSTEVTYDLFTPDYITQRYRSNNFVWVNNWSQTQHFKTGVGYEQHRLRFKGSLNYHLLNRLVLYGKDRLPYQSSVVNQLLVLRLQEHFKVRWFHLVVDGVLQWKVSGDEIRVPLAMGRAELYYQNDLFKKRLRVQVGVDASYWTSYFANAYNPALSDFHIQNSKAVGNYPFIDVFLNLRVKRFRAFVKVSHINAGWLGYRYYHVPHYPANDLAWKFGVNWAFFD